MVQTSSKWGKFGFNLKVDLECQNNRDLNQVVFHLWSKFGDSNLSGSRVIARTSK